MGKEQFQMLVSYMEQHDFFARGQIMKLGPQGNKKYKMMWKQLAESLNGIGPCVKDVSAWQNVRQTNI